MKKFNCLVVFFVLYLFVFTGCTSTEPPSCKEIEGNCLELAFDGESCTYQGPAEIKASPVTLLFFNESKTTAIGVLLKLDDDKTIQELDEYHGEGDPSTKPPPAWITVLTSEVYVPAGKNSTWKGSLESGIHALACVTYSPNAGWRGAPLIVTE